MVPSEMVHFRFGATSPEVLSKRLSPQIRDFARSGIRKPADVSRALNAAQVRTACGDKWTPRLVAMLLHLIFNGELPGFPLERPRKPSAPRTTTARGAGQYAKATAPRKGRSAGKRTPVNQRSRPGRAQRRAVVDMVRTAGNGTAPSASDDRPAKKTQRRPFAAPRGLIDKLPLMALPATHQIWLNALTAIADPARADMHEAARDVVDAVESEWLRRQADPLHPEGYFKWPSTSLCRSSRSRTATVANTRLRWSDPSGLSARLPPTVGSFVDPETASEDGGINRRIHPQCKEAGYVEARRGNRRVGRRPAFFVRRVLRRPISVRLA
jgi:hypothetical protein